MDGWLALFAAIVCVSFNGRGRIGDVWDIQDYGAPAIEGHYDARNGGRVDSRTLDGLFE